MTRWRSRLRVRQSETLLGLDWGEAEIKEVPRSPTTAKHCVLGGVTVANLPVSHLGKSTVRTLHIKVDDNSNFRIGGQFYVQFPVRPKAEQAEDGA